MTVNVIESVVDAFVNEAEPSNNYGRHASLRLDAGGGDQKFSYVYFPTLTAEAANIVSATLRLVLKQAWAGTRDIAVKRVTDRWSETNVNWNNRPAVSDTNTATVTVVDGAADDVIEVDVTAMVQQVANGATYHGMRLGVSAGGDFFLHSAETEDLDFRPELEIEWSSAPQPPAQLSPSGGAVISKSDPLLAWDYRDTDGESDQSESQVQIDTAEDFATPDFDSGWVANTEPFYDLSLDGSFGSISPGTTYYWRVRVKDSDGFESDWSDVVEFSRVATGTLTLVSPGVGGTVEETTPPISWTFSGTQESAAIALFEMNSKGLWERVWRMPREVTTDTSFNVPKNIIHTKRKEDGQQAVYKVRVDVWDGEDRTSVAGDPGYERVEQVFTYDRVGTPSPVDAFTATAAEGHVVLEWTDDTEPDYYSVRVDEHEEEQRIEPADVRIGATNDFIAYWWRSDPGEEHTFEIERVVNNAGELQHSDGNPTDTATVTPGGKFLVDDDDLTDPIVLSFLEKDESDFTIGETGETFSLIGSQQPMRVIDSQRGYEGTVSGLLWEQEDVDTFHRIKRRNNRCRYVQGTISIPVILGEASVTPSADFEAARASVEVFQVGDFKGD